MGKLIGFALCVAFIFGASNILDAYHTNEEEGGHFSEFQRYNTLRRITRSPLNIKNIGKGLKFAKSSVKIIAGDVYKYGQNRIEEYANGELAESIKNRGQHILNGKIARTLSDASSTVEKGYQKGVKIIKKGANVVKAYGSSVIERAKKEHDDD